MLKLIKNIHFLILFTLLTACNSAQRVEKKITSPNPDIVVFDLSNDGKKFSISNPIIIANSTGYDNQPSFSRDGKTIFFTRMENGVANLWSWSFENQKTQPLTQSEFAEYSPTQIPFEPKSFSTVRVEKDGIQRLWKFSGDKGYSMIFDTIKPVGYHVWDNKNIAMFILGEPQTLQVTNYDTKKVQIIDDNIGRCLQKRPVASQISYTRLNEKLPRVYIYDFSEKKKHYFATLPSEIEDYTWFSKNQIITSDGSNLFVLEDSTAKQWQKIYNLSSFKLTGISRLAISPDLTKLAIVYMQN